MNIRACPRSSYIFCRHLPRQLDVKLENIDADVRRVIKKNAKKEKEDISRNILRQTAGYGDKVNPDFAKNVHGAKAEEHIIALLMLFDEHRRNAANYDIVSSDDFITEFGKKVFEKIIELEKDGMYSESVLGESFSVDEMSRLKKIQLDRAALTNNSSAVFMDCINTLKTEKSLSVKQDGSHDETDILSIIDRKKQAAKKKTEIK